MVAWWSRLAGRRSGPPAEVRALDLKTVFGSQTDFLQAVGILPGGGIDLPVVTIESALQVPAVSAAVTFLSRALGTLPLHLFRTDGTSAEKIDGGLAVLLRDAPNPELTSVDWRRWCWQQVFTGGRALSWIERSASGQVAGIWPMDPGRTRIERRAGRLLYWFDQQSDPYPAADVIDTAWMLRSDGVGHWSPIMRGARTIARALAMMDYSARLFAKGGVPPLTLVGPPGTGAEAMKRALEQVNQALRTAQELNIPLLRLPAGFELKPIGFNPRDGQMVEEGKAITLDIARLYSMPPVFLQDLEFSTFTNSEQQDLQLIKHLILHWTGIFEQQLNLKLFGQRRADRQVKHNIEHLERADFKSWIEGLVRSTQGSILTPNEARARIDVPRSADPAADKLYMQGATLPIDGGGKGDQNGGTGNAN